MTIWARPGVESGHADLLLPWVEEQAERWRLRESPEALAGGLEGMDLEEAIRLVKQRVEAAILRGGGPALWETA